jgi:DNA-directed RNA polymerase specialized sigma24 family protein
VHCYRMLGSFQDAEDTLQETLLAAWRGFGGFEERSSLRTWLYQIGDEQVSQRASLSEPTPGQGVGCAEC